MLPSSAHRPFRFRFRLSLLVMVAGVFGCDSATDPGDGTQVAPEPRIIYSAYTDETPEGALFSADIDGANVRQMGERVVTELDVSADGQYVAYDLFGGSGGGRDVYVLELATGQERRLTSGGEWNSQPVWSPDGARLAFTAERGGVFGVSVMNADGTNERRVSGDESAESPAWSNEGDRIAYSLTDHPDQRVVVADVDGPIRRTIADRRAWSLDWGKDDAYLLAIGVLDENGNGGIVRLDSDGSGALSLTPTSAGEHGRARWSPDGRRILFSAYDREAKRLRLHVMNADGSGRSEIPVPGGFTGAIDWLP